MDEIEAYAVAEELVDAVVDAEQRRLVRRAYALDAATGRFVAVTCEVFQSARDGRSGCLWTIAPAQPGPAGIEAPTRYVAFGYLLSRALMQGLWKRLGPIREAPGRLLPA